MHVCAWYVRKSLRNRNIPKGNAWTIQCTIKELSVLLSVGFSKEGNTKCQKIGNVPKKKRGRLVCFMYFYDTFALSRVTCSPSSLWTPPSHPHLKLSSLHRGFVSHSQSLWFVIRWLKTIIQHFSHLFYISYTLSRAHRRRREKKEEGKEGRRWKLSRRLKQGMWEVCICDVCMCVRQETEGYAVLPVQGCFY